MFDTIIDILQSRGNGWFYGVALGGGTLLFILAGWLGWHYAYLNPQNVFWASVNNNLIIDGVTKHVAGQDKTGSQEQYDQISLGTPNLVKTVATVSQGNADRKNTIVTEALGTPDANFTRYTKIETSAKTATGQPADFSKVVNQWGKQDLGNSANGAFADAIFDIVPFAHLNAQQRNQIVGSMKHDNVYDVDFSAVEKSRQNGHLYYTYTVTIAPDKYISMLKQTDNLMGLNQLKNLDPAQYQNATPVQVKITVDAVARQLANIEYVGTNRKATYTAWGARHNQALPTNTISQAALQAKLNAVVSGQ